MTTERVTTSTVRVRYAETDAMGVAYYANYLVWFEVGRSDYLRERGWPYTAMEAEGLFMPVVEASCEYLRPSRYDDVLTIRTTATRVSPLRIEFRYEVVNEADGSVTARGRTVHVAVDGDGRPRRVPERLQELFA